MHFTPLPLLALVAASDWDIALTIGLFVLGGSMSLTAWLFRKRMEAYDEHLRECRGRAVSTGRMEERIKTMEGEVARIRISTHYLSTCIWVIGTKLGVELPERPEI